MSAWVTAVWVAALSGVARAEPVCEGPELSGEQVKAIVERERAARADLPPPFERYRWSARREGCYYLYLEYALPETPDRNQIFTLNPEGVVVDVQSGRTGEGMECPDSELAEPELAEIVARAREARDDLPPPFDRYRTRVDRLRCLYLYFEYRLPERPGDHQVFTIDPFGGLMGVQRSEPYR